MKGVKRQAGSILKSLPQVTTGRGKGENDNGGGATYPTSKTRVGERAGASAIQKETQGALRQEKRLQPAVKKGTISNGLGLGGGRGKASAGLTGGTSRSRGGELETPRMEKGAKWER